ncbi:uncharacterized protein Z520_06587 [Fonsecaea multimorphosa CBS 102226]|uniref:Uncharacterized protein n=1 Tax=Fonsecaea multimorphosa CBS 102226 TaxID=1442371 RepID=A0A0D2K3P2_9EURO|nr:uncharacterized protein Z520_06587 [Fonsecaea multimorphosa CBS 102226]KIX97809.1 hypothetical protein Z520_06587 [Fonsecaea multimorphosa CBS 102226]OAL23829.1 hypothetical protein AYO22_06148 [Fonsecaea multimorphosa]
MPIMLQRDSGIGTVDDTATHDLPSLKRGNLQRQAGQPRDVSNRAVLPERWQSITRSLRGQKYSFCIDIKDPDTRMDADHSKFNPRIVQVIDDAAELDRS